MTHWITDIEDEVLGFWFGEGDEMGLDPGKLKMWFTKSDQTDREITARFKPVLDRASGDTSLAGLNAPRTLLAMIIVLDQFSRNIHRGRRRAFATDAQALSLSLDGIANGVDLDLNPTQRLFFYLPLEHAEDLDMQNRSVALFQRLADEVTAASQSVFQSFLDYAIKHRDVIARFGRFPHRNDILGRQSTQEEIEYLKQPGSGF